MKGKKQLKIAVILLFVCMCGVFGLKQRGSENSVVFQSEEDSPDGIHLEEPLTEDSLTEDLSKEKPVEAFYVHVCGAVRREGVYRLEAPARVVDALEAAGGLTEEAAGTYLNQAESLWDGMQIYVPTRQELEEMQGKTGMVSETSGTPGMSEGEDTGRIDLNRADKSTLMTLPGIGESKAEAILQYRKDNGAFRQPEDLMKVPGIKEGTYEKIKHLVQIGA